MDVTLLVENRKKTVYMTVVTRFSRKCDVSRVRHRLTRAVLNGSYRFSADIEAC